MVSGLIIDAFGELRDQQEQVKEDMEVREDGRVKPFVSLLQGFGKKIKIIVTSQVVGKINP